MNQHTISSALRRINGVAGELAKVDQRLHRSTVYKEGEEPTFSFEELRVKRKELVDEMIRLKAGVAVANSKSKLPNGQLLIVAVHELSQLKGTIALLESMPTRTKEAFIQTEIERDYEGGSMKVVKVETSMICKYTERVQVRELEKLREEFAAINRMVEDANHVTRLPDE